MMNEPDHPHDFSELITVPAHWLLVACAAWGALLCAAALVEVATSGRLRATSWVGCPPVLRRVLLAGLGAMLAVAPGPATAFASPREPSTPASTLPPPARTLGPTPPSTDRLRVRPGDTLWHLAVVRLSRGASAAEVCQAVERLHRRNSEVIGPDPDLLLPGQLLVVPPLRER